MTKALFRDTLRAMRKTLSRFISIVIIVALGVGFFAGLKAVSPTMKAAAQSFYKKHMLADIVVQSTVYFDEKDVEAVRGIPGVESVTLSRSIDGVFFKPDGKPEQSMSGTAYVTRVIGYDFKQPVGSGSARRNQLQLVKGRFPERPDECVVSAYANKMEPQHYVIGQKLRICGDFEDIRDTVKSEIYTVVGVVYTPEFIAMELGASKAGGGELSGYIYIPDDAFVTEYYTTMYIGVEDASEYAAYTAGYKDLVRRVTDKLEIAGPVIAAQRAQRMTDYLIPLIEDGRKELEQGKADLEELRKAIANYAPQYDAGKRQMQEAPAKYQEQLDKYNANKAKYDEAYEIVVQHPGAWEEYQEGVNQIERAENSYNVASAAVAAGKSALNVANKALESGEDARIKNAMSILALYFPLEAADQTIEGLRARVAEAQAQLDEQEAALAEAKAEINAGKAKLAQNKALIAQLEEFNRASKELTAAKAALDKAWAEIQDAPDKLTRGEESIADMQAREITAARDVANGERKLRRAENHLIALDNAQWIILDRDEFAGYTSYGNISDNMEQFALIFPALFFLVALLMTLTTMTRMVGDERTQLGVLKAAGYSSGAILFKYLFYAFTAGLLGCVIGLALGFTIIPMMIFKAYQILYLIPEMTPGFFWDTAALGFGAALGVTVVTTVFSVMWTLRHRPAQLMRPKAPKAGKRIFLEWFPFLWKRLGFNGKVTMRNLVRNKIRFLMTFAGILSCTALLLTGFGIGNSIGTMLDKQFGADSVMRFDGQALLQAPLRKAEAPALLNKIFRDERIASVMPVYMKKMYGGSPSFDHQLDVTIVVAQDKDRIPDFAALSDEKTGKPIPLTDEGCIIGGKTAELLGLKVGDTITIQSAGPEKAEIKVAGIVRNYVYHYIYMTPQVYERGFGVKEAAFNVVLIRLAPALTRLDKGSDAEINQVKETRTALARDLGDTAEVITLVYNQSIIDNVGRMLDIMRSVIVVVFTGAAGALAFVVLYNLNNINIYERTRELATIKVLGFYDGEADMFIYRENIITTILGIGAGLAAGIPIHGFVIKAAEIESMMFVRTLAMPNFLASAIITVIFAVAINLLMHKRIKEINMVEALKSVE
ncbi:MAG: ABC transporter permease [Firmicutes bacterium]|nr:ABC transporter permease [Bacillota bacterium]